MTEQKTGEFRASKFVGIDIYGSENEKIGDVNEILMDGSGNAKAIVIGVGGFLGIGQKNVAVPFSSVEWKNERMMAERTAPTSASAPMIGSATNSAASPAATAARDGAAASGAVGSGMTGAVTGAPMGTTATGSAGTGTGGTGTGMAAPGATGAGMTTGTAATATSTSAARNPAETAAYNGYPDHGMVKMTKADLQNAPAFKYYSETASNTGASSTATPPATPRQ